MPRQTPPKLEIHILSHRHGCPHPDCTKQITVRFTQNRRTGEMSSEILNHEHAKANTEPCI